MLWWKFVKLLMLFSKPQLNFSLNFASLSSVMKDSSSVLFYIKHYVLFSEGTNQSGDFWHFWVLRSKFTKFLSVLKQQIRFFSNFTSIFSLMRHNSSVLFSWNVIYFQQKEPIQVQTCWNCKSEKFGTMMGSLRQNDIKLQLKKYRTVTSHDTAEWYEV